MSINKLRHCIEITNMLYLVSTSW